MSLSFKEFAVAVSAVLYSGSVALAQEYDLEEELDVVTILL